MRYKVIFQESYVAGKWVDVTQEEYTSRLTALRRVFAAIQATYHSVSSVSITLLDTVLDNAEVITFTFIVD